MSDALDSAGDAALRVRGGLNEIAARKASQWGFSLAGFLCKKALPAVAAVTTYFSTGDLRAAGREAFLDLTGADIPTTFAQLTAAGFDEAARQRDAMAEIYGNYYGFNPFSSSDGQDERH
jgi:hypothetical protein